MSRKPDMAAVGRRVSEWANSPAGRKAIMEEPEGSCEAGVLHPEAPRPRFFIDHGLIHDRVTGKHVRTDEFEGGIQDTLELLNRGLLGRGHYFNNDDPKSGSRCVRCGRDGIELYADCARDTAPDTGMVAASPESK